jgi:Domain of unknown function (DUF4394)/PEP-CTERM motif
MKTKAFRYLFNRRLLAFTVALAGTAALSANAELLYGVSDQLGELLRFDSTAPANVFAVSIKNVQPGEQIRGLDWVSGTLYGLGDQNHLYTLDPNTGTATQVGAFTPTLFGIDYGFNAAGTQFYISSDEGQNLTLNPITLGTTVGPNYPSASSVDGMAYDHVSGKFYGVSAASDSLLQLNPTTGGVTTVGATGVSFADRVGFDISVNTGVAYLGAAVGGQTELFTVNESTGLATLVGTIGTPGEITLGLDGLAAAAIPEPGTVVLLGMGGLLLAAHLRRKS